MNYATQNALDWPNILRPQLHDMIDEFIQELMIIQMPPLSIESLTML